MRIHCMLHLFITFMIGWLFMTTQAQGIDWDQLTPYQKHLVTFVLPESSADIFKAEEIEVFLQKYGTRSGIYHAVGMLYRNQGADRKNAQLVMREILKLQHDMPGDKKHGMWRTGVNKDREDQNWREFIGVGFIVARAYFEDVLDPTLVREIDAALVRAAQGALERDVSAEYTNIALMSAFLLDYTGHLVSNSAFVEKGKNKAKEILDLFSRYGTFTEFNSPTYYGTNLLGLGLWRELGQSGELRMYAKEIESVFWKHIAQGYHPGLKNMCGPYVRGYGMDMTQYTALTGICIAMGLENADHAPVPNFQNRTFEWAYAPLYALLDVKPPEDLLGEFKAFTIARELSYQIPRRKKVYEAQMVLEPTWMMGAATGMRRRWNQHCPGTVHWAVGDQVAWLLVDGENAAEVKIADRGLQVFLTEPDADHPLRILVHAPQAHMTMIEDDRWTLPGMTFRVEGGAGKPKVAMKTEKDFGEMIEILFPVSDTQKTNQPALVITPLKTD